MSIEIISLVASSVVGFLFKMIAQNAADRAEQQRLMLERYTANAKSINEARKYDTPHSQWVRQFLVISFMGMALIVLLAPAIGYPTVVEHYESGIKILGLFEIGGRTVFETIDGIIAPVWLGQAVMSIVGFYFGQSVASRKHL
jgi:hypothetical protein|tara:strand:+ start:125 stop:553 length:429 start_codon:yes stop_codon:yes gene_type:complete